MIKKPQISAADHYGHRKRLRERFLKGPDALPDYELLELFLCMIHPRIDTKPLAKRLMQNFPTLGRVVYSDYDRLKEIEGVGEKTFQTFLMLREFFQRLLKQKIEDMPRLDGSQKVRKYCRLVMQNLGVEHFRLLFLDAKGGLIADEVQQKGTVDKVAVYPREVVKRAITLEASAVIMAHNHPSGCPSPSESDFKLTESLKTALQVVHVKLLDHVIVGLEGEYSFRENGWVV